MTAIKALEYQLQELRERFETTRPICPPETRPFTYQKLKKGKLKRDEQNWEWVTEPSMVRLRLLGIPKFEQECEELSQEIILKKSQIKSLIIAQTLQEQNDG